MGRDHLALSASRRKVMRLLAGGTLGAVLAGSAAPVLAHHPDPCNCVHYVRSRTGLSGGVATAAGYTEKVMNGKGYKRVLPQSGAILVWDANQKGAYSAGHMAIVARARYDSQKKKWVITVKHANWGGCGIRTTTFTWGNLYGVNAYLRR